ncbi:MAG: PhnD/SsuA/transferrin family substrate-binding protein, partial [Pirellulales bacterium]
MASAIRVVLGVFLGLLLASSQADAAAVEVRVGVVAYQDLARGTADFEELFRELAESLDRPVQFRLTMGTYGDIIYWLDKGMVDVALLTPGAFAAAVREERSGSPRCEYLASRLVPHAADNGGPANYRDSYHAVCVTAEGSSLRTIDDVRRSWEGGRARFVFVDPLSASGHIAPSFALRKIGIDPAPEEVEYSYSHTNSLRLLAAADNAIERVAFVWDGAWRGSNDLPSFRPIAIPELEALHIPADVVVARAGFEHSERVIELLTSHVDSSGEHDFVRFDDWRQRYGELLHWTQQTHIAVDSDEVQALSLDGIAQMLKYYARTRPGDQPLRLALVLSGGGAKCSYQIGAVTALEEALA